MSLSKVKKGTKSLKEELYEPLGGVSAQGSIAVLHFYLCDLQMANVGEQRDKRTIRS